MVNSLILFLAILLADSNIFTRYEKVMVDPTEQSKR